MTKSVTSVDDGIGEAIPSPVPERPQFVQQRARGVVEAKMDRMERIAKSLTAGPKDVVKTRNVRLEVVDWTRDEDEPAYDVNVYVDGRPVEGGRGVFSIDEGERRPESALRKAEAFVERLVKVIVKENGGTLRG